MVNGKKVIALRDTGWTGCIVRKSLVTRTRIWCNYDWWVYSKVSFSNGRNRLSIFHRKTEALCMEDTLYDLVIGNNDGSKLPDMSHFLAVAVTRVQANREEAYRKLNQGCHLSSTSKFPDFSLTYYSFPYPLTDKKKSFLLFTVMVLTVSLKIWGLLIKERICSPREQIHSFKSSPQWGGR